MVDPQRIGNSIEAFEGIYEHFNGVPNADTLVYTLTVPEGRVWSPSSAEPFWLEFWTGDAALTPSGQNVTVSRDPLVPPGAGGAPSPLGEVELLLGTVAGTYQPLTVTGRNVGGNPRRYSFLETVTGTISAYYLAAAPARLSLFLARPEVLGAQKYEITTMNLAVSQRRNPFNRRTAQRFFSKTVFPASWRLEWYVLADYPVLWQDNRTPAVNLPIRWMLPIVEELAILYPELLDKQVEAALARR